MRDATERVPQQQHPEAPQLVDGRTADGNHGDARHALVRLEVRLDDCPDRRCFECGKDSVLLGPKRSGMMCMMCIEGGMLRSLANFRPLGKIDPRGFYPKLSPLLNAPSWGIQ